MKKILLVEDEAPIRESLQEILEMHGFEAITAENGREGFYLASTQKPDLIISDVQMPELTGYEMLELLQKNADLMHIPFIFLTSQIEHEKVRTGMNLGADDYLAKPVRMRDLLTAVENRLQKSERIKLAFDDKINDLLLTINKNVQHEFNTPLHGILGFSDLILSSQNLSPDSLKMFANAIQIAGLRLKDTLDNIMLYRSLLGNSEFFTPILTVIDENTFNAIANPLFLKYKREDSVKFRNIQQQFLDGDSKYIGKIFTEIIDNACKFSNPNDPIVISQTSTENTVSYTIEDLGMGLTTEQISQIAPFKQFDRQKYEQQGLGLGLYIAGKLMELHNGSLTILKGEQQGLKCIITFPV